MLILLNRKLDQRPGVDADTVNSRWLFTEVPFFVHVICFAGRPWAMEQFRETVSLEFTDNSFP